MSVHEQFVEDLALYAMGVLPEGERAPVEKHLQECADCRRELELLRGDAALLAYSTAAAMPPRRSRERLMNEVKKAPRGSAALGTVARPRRSWWRGVPWLAAVAMAILAVLLMRQISGLQEQMAGLRDTNLQQRARLEQAREVVATLTATNALRVVVVAAKTPPQPQGKAFYVSDRGSLIFIASNFKAAPADKAYELWLIPSKGAPIAAGVFKPDAHGSAMVMNPPIPRGVEAKAFAITIESEAGSTAPTSPIIMLGAGE